MGHHMNIIARFLSKIRFNIHSGTIGKLINFISFKRISSVQVWRFEHRFNRKMKRLVQRVCKHPTTYNSFNWNGAFQCCTFCHKYLSVLLRSSTSVTTPTPMVDIPASEQWLWENEDATAMVRRGLEQSSRGEVQPLDVSTLDEDD